MIRLSPLTDENLISAYFEKCGISFSQTSGCLTAAAGDEVLGFCLYDLEKCMTVLHLSPQNDLMSADGILRSTLHIAVEKGITDAFCDPALAEFCRKLDFIENDSENRLAIGKLFQSCHGCKDNA